MTGRSDLLDERNDPTWWAVALHEAAHAVVGTILAHRTLSVRLVYYAEDDLYDGETEHNCDGVAPFDLLTSTLAGREGTLEWLAREGLHTPENVRAAACIGQGDETAALALAAAEGFTPARIEAVARELHHADQPSAGAAISGDIVRRVVQSASIAGAA